MYENILCEYSFTTKFFCTHTHVHTHAHTQHIKTEMRAVRSMIISKQTKKGKKRERKIARARALLKVSSCVCEEPHPPETKKKRRLVYHCARSTLNTRWRSPWNYAQRLEKEPCHTCKNSHKCWVSVFIWSRGIVFDHYHFWPMNVVGSFQDQLKMGKRLADFC